AHPDLPAPMVSIYRQTPELGDMDWFLDGDGAEQKATAARIIRAIGGKWDKAPFGDTMRFNQERDGLRLCVSAERTAVCERVVIGVETVTLPAVEAQPER